VTKYVAKEVKTDRITNSTSKKKRKDKEMLERRQIIGRYENNIVLNTKKNAKKKYIHLGLGSDIVSMGEYFLTDDHSPFFLHV
jgi:hypothetical protein